MPQRKKKGGARLRATRPARRGAARARGGRWEALADDELLDWRIKDLDLDPAGTALEERTAQLDDDLERAGLRFRPYTWLSSDWFTPDDATGFAIPFFLAHPRLVRLERAQMLEVEGGSHEWCMKLLRHETAHAIDNAYGLRRRKSWRETFGRSSEPYRDAYTPDPTSRDYVLNLDYWYSQSHPLEDWAETFAVWLRPGGRWRRRYADWPRALAKLNYVDGLMGDIADEPPRLRSRARTEPVSRLSTTLREYYERKRGVYDDESPAVLDAQLRDLFGGDGDPGAERASRFLRRRRRELVERVARRTGQHRYLIDHVLRDLVPRCRALDLRLAGDEQDALLDTAIFLTALSMQFVYGGHSEYRR